MVRDSQFTRTDGENRDMVSTDVVLAFDVGGTKIVAGLVGRQGKIHQRLKETTHLQDGFGGLVRQMTDLANRLAYREAGVNYIGVASAGPLHPGKGLLLDPTNFLTDGQSWGVQDFAGALTQKLGFPVCLENDAAAAMLAERWLGHARGCDNALLLTLGTGLGVAVTTEGRLVRAGRGLHPEGGHIVINQDDDMAQTPTGIPGTAEAYLSGVHFTRRVQEKLGIAEPTEILVTRARQGDARLQQEFAEYGRRMAAVLSTFALLYGPEVVILAGGFSHAADLFLPSTRQHLDNYLSRYREVFDLMPEIKVSDFQEDMGLLGAAHLAWAKGTV